MKKSPVHEKAEQFGIPVRTPENFRDRETRAELDALEADVAVVIAYGLLLPTEILEAPRFGCFNGHASLLPRWRGAAPIQRAIMAGDTVTGVNIMKMDEGLDTGPVALEEVVEIGPDMTAGELHDHLAVVTADLMIRAMGAVERDSLQLTAQPEEGVTYAQKISKEETRIDWNQPAETVHNHIRGLAPFPGAWCEMRLGGKDQRVKILRSEITAGDASPGTVLDDGLTIACQQDAVRLVRLQRAGKQSQEAAEFLRGNRVEAVQ